MTIKQDIQPLTPESQQFIRAILDQLRTKKEKIDFLKSHVGTLSNPEKMPCKAYSLPTYACITGSKLVTVEGSTCFGCYANTGRYKMPNVVKALDIRLNSVLNSPFWAEYMTEYIRLETRKNKFFRWHDSGDLQSVKHLRQIIYIANQLPDVNFWIPTRENKIVKECLTEIPQNLLVRVSAHMVGSNKSCQSFPYRSTTSEEVTDNTCPATIPGNDHTCKGNNCFNCWNHDVSEINYLMH